MEIEGKEYDLRCECGRQLTRGNNPYDNVTIFLDCPGCGEKGFLHPQEAELFEKARV